MLVFVTPIIISLNAGVIYLIVIVNFNPCHFLADEKEDSLPLRLKKDKFERHSSNLQNVTSEDKL